MASTDRHTQSRLGMSARSLMPRRRLAICLLGVFGMMVAALAYRNAISKAIGDVLTRMVQVHDRIAEYEQFELLESEEDFSEVSFGFERPLEVAGQNARRRNLQSCHINTDGFVCLLRTSSGVRRIRWRNKADSRRRGHEVLLFKWSTVGRRHYQSFKDQVQLWDN